MAIHAITGVMGSGKSYEAVSEKLAPALKDSKTRRVVCNIEGLNFEEIAKYTQLSVDEVKSRLVVIDYERVKQPKFWYDPEATPAVIDSVVQPGDLVILDEVWRYFGKGEKLAADAMRFFRMHRHYVDPTSGDTCDVVLINQALRGIHQDIRDVVEVQFACRKLKAFGRPQNYQVFVHEGGDRKYSHKYLRKYSKAVFPLYSSYAHSNAKETVDKRQNLLGTPFFKIVIPLALFGICFGLWFTFHRFKTLGQPSAATSAAAATAAVVPGAVPAVPTPAAKDPSQDWRLVSLYQQGNIKVATIVNGAGAYRSGPVTTFRGSSGADIAVKLDTTPDDFITPYTGVYKPAASTAQPTFGGAAK